MSSEAPYFFQDYNRSLVQNGWEPIGRMIPLIMKQMGGLPVHIPGTLPDSGYGNYFDDYLEMRLLDETGRSYNEARDVDAQAQERTLSILAQRAAATAGIRLGPKQMATVRQIAKMVGTYGPMVLSAAKQALAASADPGAPPDAIAMMVNTFEQLLNSTYGPVGSRMAFYGTAKQALHRLTGGEQQDAIISEVMHKLFPEGADTQFTGGLDTQKTAAVVQHMLDRGQNPLNVNTAAMKALIREQTEKGWGGLSGAEQSRVASSMAATRMDALFKAGTREQNILKWADKQAGKAEGKMTSEAAANYAAQLEGVSSLGRDLNASGFLKESTDLNTSSIDNLQKISFEIEKRKGDYRGNTEEDKKSLEQLKELQNRVNAFTEAKKDYIAQGGNVEENITQQVDKIQQDALIEVYKKSGMSEEQATMLSDIYQKHAKLSKMGISTALLDSTAEEDAQDREKYLKQLEDNKDNIDKEALKYIDELYKQKDENGITKAEILQQNNAIIQESLQKEAGKEAQQIINQYSKLLLSGTDDEIAKFRNDDRNRPVLNQLEAIIVGNKAKEDVGIYSRSAARFLNAVQATGPAVTSDRQMVADIRGAAKMMSEITQMGGEKQLSSEDWERYWSRISYGMGTTKANANIVGQMSSTAAKIAEATGGDRVTAGMAAAELGLYMRENALLNNVSPDQATAIAGSLVGRASNNQFTHKVNAIATSISKDADLAKYKLNDNEKTILKKIQNRQLLSKEEMEYVDLNANSLLEKLGLNGGAIISALQRNVDKEEGIYATQVGAYQSINDLNTQAIKSNRLSRSFAEHGLNFGKHETLVGNLLHNIYATDDEAANDPEKLKRRLIDEIKKNVKPEEQKALLDELEKTSTQNIFNIARDSAEAVARAKGQTTQQWREIVKSADNLDNISNTNKMLGDVFTFMPFRAENRIQAVMNALVDPNSSLEDLIKAGITKENFKPENIDTIATVIGLAGITTKNKDVLGNDEAKNSKANEVFNKIVSEQFKGNTKEATEVLVKQREIQKRLREKGINSDEIGRGNKEELQKATENGIILDKSELDILSKYAKMQTVEGFEDFSNTLLNGTKKATDSINAKMQMVRAAPNSAFTSQIAAPSAATPAPSENKPEENASVPAETSSDTSDTVSVPAVTTNTNTNTSTTGSSSEGTPSSNPAATGNTEQASNPGVESPGGKLGSSEQNPVYVKIVEDESKKDNSNIASGT